MKCEEFEAIGLDAERDAALSEIECVAAREHVNTCSHCAALQESWQSAREELRALGEATMTMQAPSRVEMRLRQEFRKKHRTMKARRAAVVAAWALATAAVLVGAVSWRNWQVAKHGINSPSSPVLNLAGAGANGSGAQNEALNNSSTTVPGEDGAGDFTLLPGTLLAETTTKVANAALQHSGTQKVLAWCKQHLGITVFAQRKIAFAKRATETG